MMRTVPTFLALLVLSWALWLIHRPIVWRALVVLADLMRADFSRKVQERSLW